MGNCVQVRALSLCSQHAVTGAMGIQGPCSLPWAHWKVGPIVESILNMTSDYIGLRQTSISINLKHYELG